MGRIDQIFRFTKSVIKKRNIPLPEKVIQVRQEQQVEEVGTIITTVNTNPQYEVAYKLLQEHDAIKVVSALLNKLEKKDHSDQVYGDINEDVSKGSRSGSGSGRTRNRDRGRDRKNRSRNSSGGGKVTRFHLNVGTSSGVNAKVLADFVTEKTRLRNSQISDITIRNSFSFFSAEASKEAQVMKALTNVTLNGKRTSIQIAKDRK